MILRRIAIMSVILATVGFPGPLHTAQPTGPRSVPAVAGAVASQASPDRCLDSARGSLPSSTPVPDSRWTDGGPAGLTLTPVAIETADTPLPPPARLSLARIEYGPHSGTVTRRASGPLLFVVESGTIDIFLSGERTRLRPGASAIVQLNQRYAFANDASVPAVLLRLALTPPDSADEPVIEIEDVTPTPGPALIPPTRTWLFRGDLQMFPVEPVDLFIACAIWMQDPKEPQTHQSSGPVGLMVLDGTLHMGEQGTLMPGGCSLLQPGLPLEIRAGEHPATGLLFGVLATGGDLWLPALAQASVTAPPNAEISCGDRP